MLVKINLKNDPDSVDADIDSLDVDSVYLGDDDIQTNTDEKRRLPL